MKRLRCAILTLVAPIVTLFAPTATAEAKFDWQPNAGERLVFDVYRDGKRFGSHVVTFDQRGDQLVVNSDIELKVKFGPITAFHYVHDVQEVWGEGELVSIDARTKRDGKWEEVDVDAVADGLRTTGPEFTGTHAAGLIPSTHWNVSQMLQSKMLSTETGALLPLQVEDRGLETVRTGSGEVEARHYRVSSDIVASFWYDKDGRWVKCAFKARGSDVEYRLRV